MIEAGVAGLGLGNRRRAEGDAATDAKRVWPKATTRGAAWRPSYVEPKARNAVQRTLRTKRKSSSRLAAVTYYAYAQYT